MRKAFRASRLMGLTALAFGLMAFGATAAQAETGAHFNVSGSAVTTALKAQLQATLENNDGILLTKIGLSKLELLCTSMKLVDALLLEGGSATGKAHFEGCVIKVNGVVSPVCKPHSPGAAEGLIETNILKGLIVLHEVSAGVKIPLLQVLPSSGSSYVTMILGKEVGNECPVGAKYEISGKLFSKDTQNEGSVEKVTHLFEEGPLSVMSYGGNAMTLDGSANVSLAGAHLGLKFGMLPG
jgi:hypothetical protein